MPFTVDRSSITAAQLNTLWSLLVTRIAPTLPIGIRDPNGDGSNVFDDLDISDTDDAATRVITVTDLAGALVEKGNEFGGATFLNQPLALDTTASTISVNQLRTSVDISLPTAQLAMSEQPPQFSSTSVIMNGDTDLLITAARVVSTQAIGWNLSNSIGDPEEFKGIGIIEWNPGLTTVIGLVEAFNGTGIDEWQPGTLYRIAKSETDWSGFPAGTSPSTPSTGGCLSIEDLTSQVNGSAQTFTLSKSYESGTLRVYLNGQRLGPSDFTEDSTTTFTLTSHTPSSPDEISVDFCAC